MLMFSAYFLNFLKADENILDCALSVNLKNTVRLITKP